MSNRWTVILDTSDDDEHFEFGEAWFHVTGISREQAILRASRRLRTECFDGDSVTAQVRAVFQGHLVNEYRGPEAIGINE